MIRGTSLPVIRRSRRRKDSRETQFGLLLKETPLLNQMAQTDRRESRQEQPRDRRGKERGAKGEGLKAELVLLFGHVKQSDTTRTCWRRTISISHPSLTKKCLFLKISWATCRQRHRVMDACVTETLLKDGVCFRETGVVTFSGLNVPAPSPKTMPWAVKMLCVTWLCCHSFSISLLVLISFLLFCIVSLMLLLD